MVADAHVRLLQDKADDVKVGVKSTALLFGDRTKPVLAAFAAGSTALLAGAGYAADMAWPFYLGVAGAGSHMAWQVSIHAREPLRGLQPAFLTVGAPVDCIGEAG